MKHFEFWNPRLFELPCYRYLLMGVGIRGLSVRSLAKVDDVKLTGIEEVFKRRRGPGSIIFYSCGGSV